MRWFQVVQQMLFTLLSSTSRILKYLVTTAVDGSVLKGTTLPDKLLDLRSCSFGLEMVSAYNRRTTLEYSNTKCISVNSSYVYNILPDRISENSKLIAGYTLQINYRCWFSMTIGVRIFTCLFFRSKIYNVTYNTKYSIPGYSA